MATDPKNPSNLPNYNEVRVRQTAAMRVQEASEGLLGRMGGAIKRWATGESQLEDTATHPPAAAKNDHVLRWYDTGEPYKPEAEKPKNPSGLKPYEPHASTIPNPIAVVTAPASAPVQNPVAAPAAVPEETVAYYAIQKGDTLGSIAKKQADLRTASGLEGDSSTWAVAIATAKLNGMESVNDTIRVGATLQLPSAEMVRETVQALSQSVAADGKISWSEAKSVEAQHVGTVPANPQVVSR